MTERVIAAWDGHPRAATRWPRSSSSTGCIFATLFSRVPDLRERLDLSNGALGLLLLSISVGSLLGPARERAADRALRRGRRGARGRRAVHPGHGHRRARRLRPRGGAGRRRRPRLLRVRYGGLGRRHERRGRRGRAPPGPHGDAAVPRGLELRLDRRGRDRRGGRQARRPAAAALHGGGRRRPWSPRSSPSGRSWSPGCPTRRRWRPTNGRPGWSHARWPSARWCWRSRWPRARPTTGSPWPWSTATPPGTGSGWPASRCS